MALRTIVFVIVQMLLCSTLLGELVIKAPEAGKEHEVVEFSIQTNKADVLVEVNKTLFKSVRAYKLESDDEGESKYVFTAPPGKYRIKAIGFDPGIEVATAVVEIKSSGTTRPEEPPDEDNPDNDYSSITKLCSELVSKLKDQPTQDSLKLRIAEIKFNGTIEESKQELKTAIIAVLASRQGQSKLVDWYGGWRVPLNSAIEKLELKTIGDFRKLVGAIVDGLSVSPQSKTKTASGVVVQSNCYFCQECGAFHCRN